MSLICDTTASNASSPTSTAQVSNTVPSTTRPT
jgi:hypothetical protein